jgi:hypothetical protein
MCERNLAAFLIRAKTESSCTNPRLTRFALRSELAPRLYRAEKVGRERGVLYDVMACSLSPTAVPRTWSSSPPVAQSLFSEVAPPRV